MENNNTDYSQYSAVIEEKGSLSKSFFANVFLWMFVALGISALAAFFVANSPALISQLVDFNTGRRTLLGTIVMFAPLAFVFIMSLGFNKLSFPVLAALFVAYAGLTGLSLGFILLAYTATSVVACFLSAAGIFGIMAVMGYTTNVDLTKFGSILMIGLVGLVLASLINMFMQSERMAYILSFFGVAIFTALTAYDVQKIKRIGEGIEYGDSSTKKMVIMGALTLYLDFINIFLYLIRIFGQRK